MNRDIWDRLGWEQQQLMAQGHLTSLELTSLYMERIAALNGYLRALISVNPHALATAESLDRERKQGRLRGPLHGLPIVVKDNIDLGDGTVTSAGSLALAQNRAGSDAFVVKRLRQAGVVILGKANLTEWANFISRHMPNGFSALGGQTKNLYGESLDTGGSSSGTASAVAAGFSVMGVGTETSGSILSPASEHGLVGIKPTVGLISRSGIVPISHSQDTAGPIARCVRDAALMLNAMVGEDESDPATSATSQFASPDYAHGLHEQALHGARLGLVRDPYWENLTNAERTVMESAIARLRDLGAEVVEDLNYPPSSAVLDIDVLLHEFGPALERYLARTDPSLGLRTLADVIAFNYAHAPQSIPYGQDVFIQASQKGGLESSEYLQARIRDLRYTREWGLDRIFSDHGLDGLLFPGSNGALVPAKAGYPSVIVPAGQADDSGRPLGLTFTGPAFSEARLLALAYSFEQNSPARPRPDYAALAQRAEDSRGQSAF